jgi:hypothetical protein
MAVFEARSLHKRFGDQVVLEQINLSFEAGQLSGIRIEARSLSSGGAEFHLTLPAKAPERCAPVPMCGAAQAGLR